MANTRLTVAAIAVTAAIAAAAAIYALRAMPFAFWFWGFLGLSLARWVRALVCFVLGKVTQGRGGSPVAAMSDIPFTRLMGSPRR